MRNLPKASRPGPWVAFMNAIELVNVTKVYRRYARRKQFATLKSALLKGSLIQDLQPDEKFPGPAGRVVQRAGGKDLRHHRPQRIRQEHGAEAGGRHYQADDRHREGERPHFGADRAGRRLPSGNLRPRERLHQRHHARPVEARGGQALRRDRRVRRAAAVHRRAGEDLLVRHVYAPRALPWPFTSIPTCCWWTKCWPWATKASRTSASTSSASSSAGARPFCSSRIRSASSSASATRRCGSTAAKCAARATRSGSWAPI